VPGFSAIFIGRTNLLTSLSPHGFLPDSTFMSSTTEPAKTEHSLTPENFPFTAPQLMSRYVTDTGKILPRKYTGLSARQQRAVTKTIKNSRNLLLAK
jgi:small subunit ribosomal protein S18